MPDSHPSVLISSLVVVAAYLLLFGLGEALRRLGRTAAATRRVIHVGSALPALALPALFDSPQPVLILAAGFVTLMVVSARLGLLGSIHDIKRRSVGAAMYPLAIAAAFSIAAGTPAYYAAVAALGLGDPAAAVVGERIGRRRFVCWGSLRTVEGSLAAAIVTSVAVGGVVLATGGAEPTGVLLLALGAGAAAALAEAASPAGLDNATMPLVVLAAFAVAPSSPALSALLAGLVALVGVGTLVSRRATVDALLAPVRAIGARR